MENNTLNTEGLCGDCTQDLIDENEQLKLDLFKAGMQIAIHESAERIHIDFLWGINDLLRAEIAAGNLDRTSETVRGIGRMATQAGERRAALDMVADLVL